MAFTHPVNTCVVNISQDYGEGRCRAGLTQRYGRNGIKQDGRERKRPISCKEEEDKTWSHRVSTPKPPPPPAPHSHPTLSFKYQWNVLMSSEKHSTDLKTSPAENTSALRHDREPTTLLQYVQINPGCHGIPQFLQQLKHGVYTGHMSWYKTALFTKTPTKRSVLVEFCQVLLSISCGVNNHLIYSSDLGTYETRWCQIFLICKPHEHLLSAPGP